MRLRVDSPASETSAPLTEAEVSAFRAQVREMAAAHSRDDLPWRFIDDAYGVYLSEVMLQQTQVARVLTRWPRFLAKFPTLDALASADPADVVREWQGLGYNRRALALHACAQECARQHGGRLPDDVQALQALPGIGPATAAGICCFAYQKPAVYLETNVRAVMIHSFFPERTEVRDRELIPLIEQTLDRDDPRGWYYALLDYGAYLKRTMPNPSRRSAHHATQSRFEGSWRQKRAFLLREALSDDRVPLAELASALDRFERERGREAVAPADFDRLIAELRQDGFFDVDEGFIRQRGR